MVGETDATRASINMRASPIFGVKRPSEEKETKNPLFLPLASVRVRSECGRRNRSPGEALSGAWAHLAVHRGRSLTTQSQCRLAPTLDGLPPSRNGIRRSGLNVGSPSVNRPESKPSRMRIVDPIKTSTALYRTSGSADFQSFLTHLLRRSLPMDQKPAMH